MSSQSLGDLIAPQNSGLKGLGPLTGFYIGPNPYPDPLLIYSENSIGTVQIIYFEAKHQLHLQFFEKWLVDWGSLISKLLCSPEPVNV